MTLIIHADNDMQVIPDVVDYNGWINCHHTYILSIHTSMRDHANNVVGVHDMMKEFDEGKYPRIEVLPE